MIRKGIAGCSNFFGQGVCASIQTWGGDWSYIDLLVLDPSKIYWEHMCKKASCFQYNLNLLQCDVDAEVPHPSQRSL